MQKKIGIAKNSADQLVIVSGASNGIGKKFFGHFRRQKGVCCIGISRTKGSLLHLDLMNKEATAAIVSALPLEGIKRIIHIHSIGIDKFEPNGKPQFDNDNDGIDDAVYSSNVTAFFNLAEPLIGITAEKKIELLFCHVGSISDSHLIPYWQSFSRSKNIVRKFLRFNPHSHVKGLFLNVSSTLVEKKDGGGQFARPLSDTKCWLKPSQIVKNSVAYIENFTSKLVKYAEFDFVNPSPQYSENYFTDLRKLYDTWQKNMGYEGKPVPHGIRI